MKDHLAKLFCLLSSVFYPDKKSGFRFATYFLLGLNLLVSISASAQNSVDDKAADFLRESNNLYVVISILVTIFAGIIIFLIFQERKISKLEKQLKDRQS